MTGLDPRTRLPGRSRYGRQVAKSGSFRSSSPSAYPDVADGMRERAWSVRQQAKGCHATRLALCAKEIAIERILLLAEKHALVIHDL
jgi:hypothetical protein